jgi:hypothetical protein
MFIRKKPLNLILIPTKKLFWLIEIQHIQKMTKIFNYIVEVGMSNSIFYLIGEPSSESSLMEEQNLY